MRRVLCVVLLIWACAISLVAPTHAVTSGKSAAPIPPSVVTKAFGCHARTGQCDLIVAYVPRPKGQALVSWRDLALEISDDGKWVACRSGSNTWCRRIGSMRWYSRSDCALRFWRAEAEEHALRAAERILAKETRKNNIRLDIASPATCEVIAVRTRPGPGSEFRPTVLFFDRNGRLRTRLPEGKGRLLIAWSPDGSAAAIGTESERDRMSDTIVMMDCKTFQMRREVFRDRPIHAEWSPDGKYIALVTSKSGDPGCSCGLPGGTLAIFDPKTSRVTRYPQYSPAGPPVWSPDGRYLALTLRGGLGAKPTFIFDMRTRSARPVPRALRKVPEDTSVSWSPDGRYVAYGSWRDGMYLLDTWAWHVVRAGKKDAYLPRGARDGEYILVRPPAHEPGWMSIFGWDWAQVGQVIGYDLGWRKGDRIISHIFVCRAGKPGRSRVLTRVCVCRRGKPIGAVLQYDPLAFTYWARGFGPYGRYRYLPAWAGLG